MSVDVERVDAGWIGRAFRSDPDLSFPLRPRLIAELLILPLASDGMMFVGSEHTQVFRGRSAVTILPRILPLLDGWRTISDIVSETVGLTEQTIFDVVSLLFSRGLIEDGRGDAPMHSSSENACRFLGRYNDVTRFNGNREEAMSRVTRSSVGLIGPSHLLQPLVDQLALLGVGSIHLNAEVHRGVSYDLCIVVSDVDTDREICSLDWLYSDGARCLLFRLGATEAHFGPMLQRNVTCCPRCFIGFNEHPSGACDALMQQFWLSLASLHVFHALSRVAPGLTHAGFRVLSLNDGVITQRSRLAVRSPGCVACGLATAQLALTNTSNVREDSRMLAWIYHCATSLMSQAMLSPKEHQGHYLISNVKLAQESRPLIVGEAVVSLPGRTEMDDSGEELAAVKDPESASVDLLTLSTILSRTGGEIVDAGVRRRVAPTGGNLGSVNLWVVARCVEGLSPGVYYYDAAHDTLVRFGDLDDGEMCRALRLELSNLSACYLVGTGSLGKCAEKYGAFAYRLVYLDSGVALAYLYTATVPLRISLGECPDFDDKLLAEFLGLSTRWEVFVPTFVTGLGPKDADASSADISPAAVTIEHLSARDYSFDTMPRLLEAAGLPPSEASAAFTTTQRTTTRVIPPAVSLDWTMDTRRAIRSFSAAPVARSVITNLMLVAADMKSRRAERGAAVSPVRPVLLNAIGSSDLLEGVYELDLASRDLVRRSDFSQSLMFECINQRSIANSAFAIVMIADLAEALNIRGFRGYRELAQQAGSAIGRAWLAATAHDLVGTAAGGVIRSGFFQAAGMDGFSECPLLSLNLGHRVVASSQ